MILKIVFIGDVDFIADSDKDLLLIKVGNQKGHHFW